MVSLIFESDFRIESNRLIRRLRTICGGSLAACSFLPPHVVFLYCQAYRTRAFQPLDRYAPTTSSSRGLVLGQEAGYWVDQVSNEGTPIAASCPATATNTADSL